MHIRGPAFRLDDTDLDHLMIGHPERLPVAPFIPSGKLKNRPGGGAVIHDEVTTVEVHRDGTAHFHDKSDFDVHLHLPIPSLHFLRDPERAWREWKEDVGEQMSRWYQDPYAEVRKGPASELPEHLQGVPGQCDEWLTNQVACQPFAMPPSSGVLIDGKADITAYLMRKLHAGDPYGARKRELLEATFDERAARGGEFLTEQLLRSGQLMLRNLEQLWASTRDPDARRRMLFAMWDECAEGEGALGEAGERARAIVIGWIRSHLPAGSPDAYTADAIESLSRIRSSKQAFAPY
jgi:hypothetical protein